MCLQSAADKSAVEKAIEAAKETCEQGNVGACAAAWDEVPLCFRRTVSPGTTVALCQHTSDTLICGVVQVEELAANVSDKKLTVRGVRAKNLF